MYFCTVKRKILIIWGLLLGMALAADPFNSQFSTLNFSLDDIILDIYNAALELGETDYEQVQTDLYALHDNPIDLNHTSDEELSQLYFLSPRQIDELLTYADKHPFESLYELRMIQSLTDYEIRDLLPFVTITHSPITNNLYPKEVFAHANHELIARVDARKIEEFEGPDPMYVQTRYRFDYKRRVIFGGQLRRPAGGTAKDLQYGLYLQLTDVAPHLHKVVAGNYQAAFGQGLVLAPVFRSGKSNYVASVGQTAGGLRYYSSVDGEGLHGVGATLRWNWGKQTRLDVSALYSMSRYQDTTWRHTVGANITVQHKKLEVQLTAIGNIYSDSIHPYRNAKYNRHYFRGRHQAVLGASVRYNYGWFDLFGEIATAQNYRSSIINHQLRKAHWGLGTIVGSRFYPAEGVSLVALYRYYSPWFDNEMGYAFSETSRLGDENGGYLGFDITRIRNWRISGYGDVFYFSGYKYGLGNDTCTLGYDAMCEVQYHSNHQSSISNQQWWLSFRVRSKKKVTSTYSARAQFHWSRGPWTLTTVADANVATATPRASHPAPTYGVSLAQDIECDLTPYTVHHTPLSLKLRLQGFDAREWANRIYLYESDVLYAFSVPATYGLGGRAYLCLKWQIIPQLALYFRFSETLYARGWYQEKHPEWQSSISNHQSAIPSRTDLHLLLRAKL